jgi:hypothetical protein
MILSSGKISKENLKLKEVEKGLFVVENAYDGEYNFFEPSPLFLKEKEKN